MYEDTLISTSSCSNFCYSIVVVTISFLQRERKRWKFVPSEFYSIYADFIPASVSSLNGASPDPLKAKLVVIDGNKVANEADFDGSTGELSLSSRSKPIVVLDAPTSTRLLTWLSSSSVSFEVSKIEKKILTRKAPPPYITSTLQQDASRKLGISPYRCMAIAQTLYEEGLITYMRTDSPHLSKTFQEAVSEFVEKTFGERYSSRTARAFDGADEDIVVEKGEKNEQKKRSKSSKKTNDSPMNAQEAHEAIRVRFQFRCVSSILYSFFYFFFSPLQRTAYFVAR